MVFSAVTYWRIVHEDCFEVSFIIGTTRFAPLKPLSIPRLELQADVLAARLAQQIRELQDVKTQREVIWFDSQTVLQ